MKPLTIDEIKQRIGDWVYLVDMIDRHYKETADLDFEYDSLKK